MHAEMLVSNSLRKKGTEDSCQDGSKNMKLKESINIVRGRGEFKASLCSKEIVVGPHI